jgi:hypothetical protein
MARRIIKQAVDQIGTMKELRFNDKVKTATITTTKAVIKVSYELVILLGEMASMKYISESILYSEHNNLKARNV